MGNRPVDIEIPCPVKVVTVRRQSFGMDIYIILLALAQRAIVEKSGLG